jgi:excisionase family DNA binding protein
MTQDPIPLAVTVSQACRLCGYGPTTVWALVRDGRLRAVRVPGIRRTLIDYRSLARLLQAPEPDAPLPRKRGRPRRQMSDFRRRLDELTRAASHRTGP